MAGGITPMPLSRSRKARPSLVRAFLLGGKLS